MPDWAVSFRYLTEYRKVQQSGIWKNSVLPCRCPSMSLSVSRSVFVFMNMTMSVNCLVHFDPIRRNWFRRSWLSTIVAIGLQNPMLSRNKVQILWCMIFIDLLCRW
jgi:hypothetical protein